MSLEPNIIPLSRGLFALVDAEDYDWLAMYKWRAIRTAAGIFYAARRYWVHSKEHMVLMHREILNAPKGTPVDHKNRNRLDNQRGNLRLCTMSQNIANGDGWRDGYYKGVYANPPTKHSPQKWNAKIKIDQQSVYLGSYLSEEEAAHAYNAAALKYFGEFARLNVV